MMTSIETLAASMRHAFLERQHTHIGGGEFTPKELRDGAIALKAIPALAAALQQILDGNYGLNKKHSTAARESIELIQDFL